jgi:hypothetical protein
MRVIVPRVPPWPGAISDVQWSDVGGMQAERPSFGGDETGMLAAKERSRA